MNFQTLNKIIGLCLRKPEVLNEYIILNAATGILADADIMRLEHIREGARDKQCSYVGIKNLQAVPKQLRAFTKASTQKSVSKVLEKRQDKTLRLCEPMIANRYINPRLIGM